MADYHVIVKDGRPTEDGSVLLNCEIERNSGEGWGPVEGGVRDLILSAADIKAITEDDALSDEQKLAALGALFRESVAAWGIHNTAFFQLCDLLPGGLPLVVEL